MRNIVQVNYFKSWINARVLIVLRWVVDLCGQELMQAGCRQIPKHFCDFDPALADYFKARGMRNGKPITLAMDYSLVARWNHSNKKRGKDERTYGSDYDYAHKWGAEVSRQTWGRHMDELAAVGLVSVSTVNNHPAYQALPYRIANSVLTFMENSHGQSDEVHGHTAVFHEPNRTFHGHLNRESSESLTSESLGSKPTTPAPDGVVGSTPPTYSEKSSDFKAQTPERRDITADGDGSDDFMETADSPPSLHAPNPVPPPLPPRQAWKEFFTGCSDSELTTMELKFGAKHVNAWIDKARCMNLDNPPGYVRSKLGTDIPAQFRYPDGLLANDPKRYISGQYADFIEH